jgi:hypothetical protein
MKDEGRKHKERGDALHRDDRFTGFGVVSAARSPRRNCKPARKCPTISGVVKVSVMCPSEL